MIREDSLETLSYSIAKMLEFHLLGIDPPTYAVGVLETQVGRVLSNLMVEATARKEITVATVRTLTDNLLKEMCDGYGRDVARLDCTLPFMRANVLRCLRCFTLVDDEQFTHIATLLKEARDQAEDMLQLFERNLDTQFYA